MLTNTNSFEIVTFRIIFLFVTDKLVYSLPSHMLKHESFTCKRPWRSCYVYVKLSSFISVYNRVRSDYTKEPLRYDEKLAIENMFMVTSSNGIEIFSALPALCMGNSPVTGEFPAQRPVTRSFDVFFDLRLNKRLSKQSWGWWFVTPSRSLWRHCNAEGSTSRHKNWNAMDDNILAADEILK